MFTTEQFFSLSPLCYLPSGKLVFCRLGYFYVFNGDKLEKTFQFPICKTEQLFGGIKLLYRLFRFGIRASIAIDENHILLSKGNYLFELDLFSKQLSTGFFIGTGIRPLIFSVVNGIQGFDDCILFGGYLGNREKKPVHIFKRTSVDKWEIVYTFEQGAINHVHNIVADPYRQCLWAFTGDFDEASAIWKITDNFKKVERVWGNDQQYRACVAFPVKDGLLYATDAPFTKNFIYFLNLDTVELKRIASIDGSCIYGCQVNDKYVFSSAVEPDGRDSSLLKLLTSRQRGAGIKDMYAHLYCGNLEKGFKEIYKEKKDMWPYLFQFGVFRFPYGNNKTNILYFQPVGTNRNDLNLLTLDLSEV